MPKHFGKRSLWPLIGISLISTPIFSQSWEEMITTLCRRATGCACSYGLMFLNSGSSVNLEASLPENELAKVLSAPDFKQRFVLQASRLSQATPIDTKIARPDWHEEILWPKDDRTDVFTLRGAPNLGPVTLVFAGDGSRRIGVGYPRALVVTDPARHVLIDGEIWDSALRDKLWAWKEAQP